MPGGILAQHYRIRLYSGMRAQHGFDLAQFDPVSADFQLMIDAPQAFQLCIVAITHQVAGAVHPRPGFAAEWIGNKSFRRQLRTIDIAARQSFTADVQLAGNAVGHGL